MSNSSIWPTDRALSSTTTLDQSGPGSDGNEEVLHILQSSSITGAARSDCLVSYRDTRKETLTSLSGCSWSILQPQPTRLSNIERKKKKNKKINHRMGTCLRAGISLGIHLWRLNNSIREKKLIFPFDIYLKASKIKKIHLKPDFGGVLIVLGNIKRNESNKYNLIKFLLLTLELYIKSTLALKYLWFKERFDYACFPNSRSWIKWWNYFKEIACRSLF